MPEPDAPPSFHDLMARLRRGDDAAAAVVFRRYVARLIDFTRGQLETWVRRKVDPEDVVQSVYKSFFARYGAGQFDVADWDSLWGLLAVITLRKCANQAHFWRRQRRDPRREVRLLDINRDVSDQEILADEPTPDQALVLTDTLEYLMRDLNAREREMLALHLQGYGIAEISRQVGRSERTVRRTLEAAREQLCRMHQEPTPVGL